MTNNQVVKVRRDALMACITCPICNKLFRDATTIPECLHTFCRKCIRKKLSDEELECCPKCNTDLGCMPLDKLRPDHNLQDIRSKTFPSKQRRVKAAELPSVTLPLRRKERSLSSLVVSTPRVSTQTTMTRKTPKATSKKKSRGSSFSVEKPPKKEQQSVEDRHNSSTSREALSKSAQDTKQNSSPAEPSSRTSPDKEPKSSAQPHPWKALSDLVDVANRNEPSELTSQRSTAKSVPPHILKTEELDCKPKQKDKSQRSNIPDGKDGPDAETKTPAKPKKLRRNQKKKAGALEELSAAFLQAVLNAGASNAGQDKRTHPIWFHLVASEQQEGEPLGQIDRPFFSVRDGTMPVSSIQKLVMSMLELASEDEVELKCMDQPLVPTLSLGDVMESWLQSKGSETISVRVGASAKEFVMKIYYARKARAA